MSDDERDVLGWWTIAGSELFALLRRTADGEDPDLIYAEAYANSVHERPGEDPKLPMMHAGKWLTLRRSSVPWS